MALAFILAGAFILLVAARIVPVDPADVYVPMFIIALCGVVFSCAGFMMLVGQQSPYNALGAMVICLSFAVVGGWIALFGASENMSGGIPGLPRSMNIWLARIFFGTGALFCLGVARLAWRDFVTKYGNTRTNGGSLSCLIGACLIVLSGCVPTLEYDGPMQSSNADNIQAKLLKLEEALVERGLPLQELKPGLSREEIDQKVERLPYTFPEELYQLYMWRNGTEEGSDLFLFRDQIFSSIDEGLSDLAFIRAYGLHNAFPFAAFEGAFYVLPGEGYAFHDNLERPVISAFEGVDVYFYSLEHLIDTQIAWLQAGIHPEFGIVNDEMELSIWKEHNPGIFE